MKKELIYRFLLAMKPDPTKAAEIIELSKRNPTACATIGMTIGMEEAEREGKACISHYVNGMIVGMCVALASGDPEFEGFVEHLEQWMGRAKGENVVDLRAKAAAMMAGV